MDNFRKAWETGSNDKKKGTFRPSLYPNDSEEQVHYIFGYEGINWALDDYDLME